MTDALLGALVGLRFNSAPTPDDVWKPSPFHVEELHKTVVDGIFEGVGAARRSDDSSRSALSYVGRADPVRRTCSAWSATHPPRNRYFFLVSLLNGKMFWESVAIATVEGLLHDGGGWGTQLTAFLRRLTSTIGLDADVRDAIAGARPLTPADMNAFITALRHHSRDVARKHRTPHGRWSSTARTTSSTGHGYASSPHRSGWRSADRPWGISRGIRTPADRPRHHPAARVDRPDRHRHRSAGPLFAQTIGGATGMFGDAADSAQSLILLGQVADGLMDSANRPAYPHGRRLPAGHLGTHQTPCRLAGADRFRELSILHRIPTAAIGQAIIAKRLALHYADVGLTPAYPTWPILPAAFTDTTDYTPRGSQAGRAARPMLREQRPAQRTCAPRRRRPAGRRRSLRWRRPFRRWCPA